MKKDIAVLGAGSWGSALAILLAKNGCQVRLWDRNAQHVETLKRDQANRRYLPGYRFPPGIDVYTDLKECLTNIRDILVVVPSHAFSDVIKHIKSQHTVDPIRIAWGTKGLDPQSNQLLHTLIAEIFSPELPAAVISGPSFAAEVAAGLPTAVTVASHNLQFRRDLVSYFSNSQFRLYENDDLVGVELCGALKNVLAIAVGICDGMGLGANARCALLTRGLVEMSRLCVALGGQPQTLLSLAGVGDLILTATDDQSRNRRFGLALGKGMAVVEAEQSIGQVVEGLQNTRQIYQLACQHKIDMPITTAAYQVVYQQRTPMDVLSFLLNRPLSTEA